MERTKTKNDDGTVLFRKIGRGSTLLILNGRKRRIKFNQTFRALPGEIPNAFKDTIIPVDKAAAAKPAKSREPEVQPKKYFLKHRGGGWYDIVNSEGKVQSEKALKKEDAEKILSSLT